MTDISVHSKSKFLLQLGLNFGTIVANIRNWQCGRSLLSTQANNACHCIFDIFVLLKYLKSQIVFQPLYYYLMYNTQCFTTYKIKWSKVWAIKDSTWFSYLLPRVSTIPNLRFRNYLYLFSPFSSISYKRVLRRILHITLGWPSIPYTYLHNYSHYLTSRTSWRTDLKQIPCGVWNQLPNSARVWLPVADPWCLCGFGCHYYWIFEAHDCRGGQNACYIEFL